MSDIKILPCPFCGGSARTSIVGVKENVKYWAIVCRNCGCKSEGWADANKAIAQWNKRKQTEQIVAQLEKCPTRTISVLKAIKIVKSGGAEYEL